jgi:hypothetical protein
LGKKARKNHGEQKRIHFTTATDCYTVEYADGYRRVVPPKNKVLTAKQRRRAENKRGRWVPARPR